MSEACICGMEGGGAHGEYAVQLLVACRWEQYVMLVFVQVDDIACTW